MEKIIHVVNIPPESDADKRMTELLSKLENGVVISCHIRQVSGKCYNTYMMPQETFLQIRQIIREEKGLA